MYGFISLTSEDSKALTRNIYTGTSYEESASNTVS